MPESAQTSQSFSQASIIAISGKQYSGKDVLAHLLLERLPDFKQVPLAGAIKQAYAAQHHISVEEVEANKAQHRPGLIALGDWGRAQDPDYWIKQVLEQPGRKIISDVRLQREYDLLRAQGAFLIRLNADRAIRAQRGLIVNEDDPTECALDDITDWDAILTNNGSLEVLTEQVDKILCLL